MANILEFRPSVLVVEDSPGWLDAMRSAVFEVVKAPVIFDFVSSAQDAWNAIGSRRYHFISCDQNFPRAVGGEVSHLAGLEFVREISSRDMLSMKTVYTAFGRSEFANYVGRIGKCEYLEKSTTVRSTTDADGTTKLTTLDWARWIQRKLEEDYIPFALELAGERLPLWMATWSRIAAKAYRQGDFATYIAMCQKLWENALTLAWAQTAALCVAAGVPLSVPDQSPASREKGLKAAWPALAAKGWLDPWRPYIGIGNKESGKGAGRLFLDGASALLQVERNRRAHNDDIAETTMVGVHHAAAAAELRPSVLFLLDALAYWVEHPLLLAPRQHPQVVGAMLGRAAAGDRVSFSDIEIAAPGLDAALVPLDPRHLHLVWRVGERTKVIDLYPFVALTRHPVTRQDDLLVLGNRTPQQWLWCSLTDQGDRTAPPLSDRDEALLRYLA